MDDKTLKQFIKFAIVGVINTSIHTLIFNIASALGFHYLISQTLGYFVSSINGFLMNYKLVFKADNADKKTVIRYYATYTMSFIIMLVMSYIYVDLLGLNPTIDFFSIVTVKVLPLLTLVVTVPFNFILSKYWVYK
jgi:Predicted membrane protein